LCIESGKSRNELAADEYLPPDRRQGTHRQLEEKRIQREVVRGVWRRSEALGGQSSRQRAAHNAEQHHNEDVVVSRFLRVRAVITLRWAVAWQL
jgi:hypothetical protein